MNDAVTRPTPPVPQDLDLSGFPWMPLDSAILSSDLYERASADALKAAIGCWCLSWKRVPASSLPGDEKLVAALLGLSPQKWRTVREWAMAGFVLHSDGRYYHALIAEQALAAGKRRQRQRERSLTYWRRNGDLLAEQAGDSLLVSEAGGTSQIRSGKVFVLPPWILPEAWAGFVKMRERIKAPLTDGAMWRTVEDLEKLRAAGEDPNACLAQSEQRGWRGVFEVKDKGATGAGPSRAQGVIDRFAAGGGPK